MKEVVHHVVPPRADRHRAVGPAVAGRSPAAPLLGLSLERGRGPGRRARWWWPRCCSGPGSRWPARTPGRRLSHGAGDEPRVSWLVYWCRAGPSRRAPPPPNTLCAGVAGHVAEPAVTHRAAARRAGPARPVCRQGVPLGLLRGHHSRCRAALPRDPRVNRHRLAGMIGDATGRPYHTDDPSWAMTKALAAASLVDLHALRTHSTLGALLATPAGCSPNPGSRSRLSSSTVRRGTMATPTPAAAGVTTVPGGGRDGAVTGCRGVRAEVVLDGALQWALGVEPDQRVLGGLTDGQAVRPASSPPACPATPSRRRSAQW